MTINITVPQDDLELKPRITVIGVGGAGGNAVNNMIQANLHGVDFIVANTDAQALEFSHADKRIQLGQTVTQGLGAGSKPDVGRAAAEEAIADIMVKLENQNMVFITAGMGGGTGTGAAPVIAQACRESGILTVGVVTKPFHFEGAHRMRTADNGIDELQQYVDTLIIIPNQNLFRIANEKTTFADAFNLADDVLHAGVRGVTDLMVMPGLINLDFADIRSVMSEMGKAMMGTGEASGEARAVDAAESAINNPLLEDSTMKGARGVLINITGGNDMTLYEVDEAANRIRDEVDPDANIIFGSTFDERLEGVMRVSVVATGIAAEGVAALPTSRPALSVIRSRSLSGQNADPKPAATEITAESFQSDQDIDTAMTAAADPNDQLNLDRDTGDHAEDNNPTQSVAHLFESYAADTAMTDKPIDTVADPDTAETVTAKASFIPPAPVVPTPQPPLTNLPDTNMPTDQASPAPEVAPRSRNIFRQITRMGMAPKEKPVAVAVERAEPAVASTPTRAQTQLDGLEPTARAAAPQKQTDNDLLDIPAFLRRQAN